MERSYPGVKNFNVSVKEIDGKVVFLRKLKEGGSEHSFGIHVASLAGMPRSIVKRATQVLSQLEEANRDRSGGDSATAEGGKKGKGVKSVPANAATGITPLPAPSDEPGMQLSFFQLDDPVLSQIRDELLGLDINNLSPLQALNKLSTLREIITGK